MLRSIGAPTNASLNTLQLGSQVVTAVTTITTTSPYETIQNSASALTHTLANGAANDRHSFFNHGAGAMQIAGTFLGGLASPRALATGNGIIVQYNAQLAGWSVE